MTPLSGAAALRLGFSQAISLWPAVVATFLARAAAFLAVAVAWSAPLAALAGGSAAATFGGAATAWIAAMLLLCVLEGGAIKQGAAQLTGGPAGSLLARSLAAARRSLSFALWSVPLAALVTLALYLFVLAPLVSFGAALASGRLGGWSSLALAFCLVAFWPLNLFFVLWPKVAFARAVDRDAPVTVSLFEAAGELARRPGAYLWIFFLSGLFEVIAAAAAGSALTSMVAPARELESALTLTLAGQVAAGVLSAFLAAFFEQARLQALVALDLDVIGMLPREGLEVPPTPEDGVPLIH